jgi:hypothetical protein
MQTTLINTLIVPFVGNFERFPLDPMVMKAPKNLLSDCNPTAHLLRCWYLSRSTSPPKKGMTTICHHQAMLNQHTWAFSGSPLCSTLLRMHILLPPPYSKCCPFKGCLLSVFVLMSMFPPCAFSHKTSLVAESHGRCAQWCSLRFAPTFCALN